MTYDVRLFGAAACQATADARHQLEQLGVPYEYVDIGLDAQAAAWVKQQNVGQPRTPTLDISGNVFVKPSASDLEEAVRTWGLVGRAEGVQPSPGAHWSIPGEGLVGHP